MEASADINTKEVEEAIAQIEREAGVVDMSNVAVVPDTHQDRTSEEPASAEMEVKEAAPTSPTTTTSPSTGHKSRAFNDVPLVVLPDTHTVPHGLAKEIEHNAKHILDFTIPSDGDSSGIDEVIPAFLVERAAGIVVLNVGKIGFFASAHIGHGMVIARLPVDNPMKRKWSFPAFFSTAGIGFGLNGGIELTHHIIILDDQNQVREFAHSFDLGLGFNISAAAGPVGRTAEVDMNVRNQSSVLHWSKSKGLYLGGTLNIQGMKARNDDNRHFYGEKISMRQILSGQMTSTAPVLAASKPIEDAISELMKDAETRVRVKRLEKQQIARAERHHEHEKERARLADTIPHRLVGEVHYAAQTLLDFFHPVADGLELGVDEVIPPWVIANCKGIAIMHVGRLGVMGSVEGGAGIVVKKLPVDNELHRKWSFPSFFSLGGVGIGFDLGFSYTSHVLFLNTDKAVSIFTGHGDVGIDLNVSAAAGPVGRDIQLDMSLIQQEPILHWSKSKGLWIGSLVSLHGMTVRTHAIHKYYENESLSAVDVLEGNMCPTKNAEKATHLLFDAIATVQDHAHERLVVLRAALKEEIKKEQAQKAHDEFEAKTSAEEQAYIATHPHNHATGSSASHPPVTTAV